ncbi:MAG: hypothetical protein AAGE01_09880 [Pseudomonadota bacterium]
MRIEFGLGLCLCLALLAGAAGAGDHIEARSLEGLELARPTLAPATADDFEAKLATARATFDREPSADALIWVGRRTAYLGRYREAIAIFTEGVRRYPDDPRMLRHRGHRFLSTRQLALAERDLTAAARMVSGRPDEVEPDGLPNARGIPTSTLHSNVFYHLGLAHHLLGEYEAAVSAWQECLAAAKNPDMEAATRYWLVLGLDRAGRTQEAAAVMAAVDPAWDIIENHAYHRLLLLFRGDLELAEFDGNGSALDSATESYGVIRWHERSGRAEEAAALRNRLLAGDQWAAFGFIAAEADRARSE